MVEFFIDLAVLITSPICNVTDNVTDINPFATMTSILVISKTINK